MPLSSLLSLFTLYLYLLGYCVISSIATPATNNVQIPPAEIPQCSPWEAFKTAVRSQDCDNAIKRMVANLIALQDGHDDMWIFSQKAVPKTISVPIRATEGVCSVVIDLVTSSLEELPARLVQIKMRKVNSLCVKNRWLSYGGYTYLGTNFALLAPSPSYVCS